MSIKTAHVFPAFTLKYSGKEMQVIEINKVDFNSTLKIASEIIEIDLSDFDLHTNNFIEQEEKNQYLSYIFSCCFSKIVKQKQDTPTLVSGFSMGIYAAYYYSGIVDFETGLNLIKVIFKTVKEILAQKKYSMASIIGFTKEEVAEIINNYKSAEIVIRNGLHSLVITGEEKEIEEIVEHCRLEGAIHISVFNVDCPYHSKILRNNTSLIEEKISDFVFNYPQLNTISMIDFTVIDNSEKAKKEIVKNVSQTLDFYNFINNCLDRNISSFIEIGAGDSLYKSSKFIERDFTFSSVAKPRR